MFDWSDCLGVHSAGGPKPPGIAGHQQKLEDLDLPKVSAWWWRKLSSNSNLSSPDLSLFASEEVNSRNISDVHANKNIQGLWMIGYSSIVNQFCERIVFKFLNE